MRDSPALADVLAPADWETIEHHVRFGESSDHETLIERLSIMLAGKPSSYHVEFHSRETLGLLLERLSLR